MAENEFKEGVKYTPKSTKPSKDKAKQHCKNLTDEEIERIKSYSIEDGSEKIKTYNWRKMKNILRSIILKSIMNIEGYDAVDLVSEDKMHLVEGKIKSWLNLNERCFHLTDLYSFQSDSSADRLTYYIDTILPLLIVPGYEEQQEVKEDSQK